MDLGEGSRALHAGGRRGGGGGSRGRSRRAAHVNVRPCSPSLPSSPPSAAPHSRDSSARRSFVRDRGKKSKQILTSIASPQQLSKGQYALFIRYEKSCGRLRCATCSASPANGARAAPFARGRATQNETWLLPLYCAYFPKTCRYFASCDRRTSVWWVLVQFF